MSTKDDRALLEAAARAAGIEFEAVMLGSTLSGGVILKGRAGYWNPLTDDGDALRLAVKLGIDIRNFWNNVTAVEAGRPLAERGVREFADEQVPAERYAATRRAIVRAAAAWSQQ